MILESMLVYFAVRSIPLTTTIHQHYMVAKSEKVIAVNPKVRLQQLHKEFMAKGLDATAAAIASLKIMKEESGGGREKGGK